MGNFRPQQTQEDHLKQWEGDKTANQSIRENDGTLKTLSIMV